jgi:radical SAM superfamily enzyme YgiQ (UPF0313 family)
MVGVRMKPEITLVFPRSSFLINETMFPPLGMMYLSAYLKQHFVAVQMLDMALPGTLPEHAEGESVGISITTPQRDEAFKLAKFYREAGKKMVIAGGPHATHMPQDCLNNGFTHVVQGYGEQKLLSLMRPFLDEIDMSVDEYPFPDRDGLPIKQYYQEIQGRPATVIMSSRGCPYHCSFCSKIDDRAQYQSAQRTLDEIFFVNARYGFDAFTMYDDTFAADRKRLEIMSEELGKENYVFRCFCRANLITPVVARQFAIMGVETVGIGIESGSDEVLKRNLKRSTRDLNSRAIRLLREVGIKSKAFLIVGLPGETERTVQQTIGWIEETQPDDISVSIFQPLPGSDIHREPKKWGIHMNGRMPLWYRGRPGEYESISYTDGLSAEQIVHYRDIIESLYKPQDLLK